MDVTVSLARDSYHALYTSMRALYRYPASKMAGTISPSPPPVLSFLAPATLVTRSRRQLLPKKKSYTRPLQLSPYSTVPKAPQAAGTSEKRDTLSTGDLESEELSLDGPAPDTLFKDDPDFTSRPGRRIWRWIPYDENKTAAGWANHTGYFSAERGPTLIHRTDNRVADSQRKPRYITETRAQGQPSKDGQTEQDEGVRKFKLGNAVSAFMMTKYLLSEGRRVQDIASAWGKLALWQQDFNIEYLVEWLVDLKRPNIAARLLEAIHMSFKTFAVGNCFSEIIDRNLALLSVPKGDLYWVSFREKQARRCLRLLKALLKPEDVEGTLRISFGTIQKTQFVAYTLCKNLPPEDLPAFYKFFLVDCGMRFRTLTILHFIDRLCKEGDYYKGYILMKCMIEEGRRMLKNLLTRKAFTLLLSKATRAGNEPLSADIIQSMYDCGLSADTPIYNVLMFNAIRCGKLESALNIYRKMQEGGHEPNSVTCAQLFHLHKRTRNLVEQQNVIQMAYQLDGGMSRFMATDVVHAAVLHAEKGRKFQSALEVYQKLFKPGVLGLMGLLPKVEDSFDRTIKQDPDVVVVTVVILAYLQDESDTHRVWQAYQRYKTLEQSAEHGPFFELQSIIANGFMYNFGRELRTMDKALEIMQDLNSPSKIRWKLKTRANRFSWSILAKSFTRHGRLDEAQWIIKAMQREGFQPTEVTWDRLLSAYLEAQRAEEAGETLGEMLRNGIKIKGQTLDMLLTVEKNEDFAKGVERVGKGEEWGVKRSEVVEVKEEKQSEEDVRKRDRAKFAAELKEREKQSGYAEKPRPPRPPEVELSVDDI